MSASGEKARERGPRHPLVTLVRRALPGPGPPSARVYLALLDRRLSALAAVARGEPPTPSWAGTAAERALARRFLRPLQGTWDDGDENLVRGYLDRWLAPGDDPVRAIAMRLIEAARALAGIEARPQTLWFFLWEMESVLESLPYPNRAVGGGL